MKFLIHSLVFAVFASIHAAAAPAVSDLPVSGWNVVGSKDTTFGPTGEAGKVVFGGPGFGDKGKLLSAYFPKTEIGEGKSLEFSAQVQFSGIAAAGHFRFGIFLKRSKDHPRGWLGYCAYAGAEVASPRGGLFARLADNNGSFDGIKDSDGRPTVNLLGESLQPAKSIKDGVVYFIKMTLTRTGEGMECHASMRPGADDATPIVEYSAVDTSPATTSFDAIGFNTHEVLSTDSIEFNEVSVKLLEP